jgi:glycosyltransferase involved in cell wall biosynthesis
MAPIMPSLRCVAGAENARISAVGAGRAAKPHQFLDILPWSEETEAASIQAMDIGIMPLTDTPWARGKCGYKLIQYMACGLPVIASPVGVNTEIVEHGVNGFLATTDADWREALVMLLRDPDLRNRMGAAGRRKVEEQYSLQVWGPRVADMLSKVAREHIA